MSRNSIRARRVAENIKRVLAPVVAGYSRDRDFGMLTLTHVDVSADIKTAILYVSSFDAKVEHAVIVESISQQVRQMRALLAQSLKMRSVPTLQVRYDDGPARSARIDALLSSQ